MKRHLRVALFFLFVALLYAGLGLLPGRTFAPLDIPLDADAWKDDPTLRVRVSNSLLTDAVAQFIPWDVEIRRLAARGELPWVSRFAGDGGPLFANPQTALFSPFVWPRLLLGLDGWAIMAILKLLAAALTAYWFARELGIERSQAMVSAFVYATAGYTIVWLLYPITGVFAVLPGLAAAALRLMKQPGIHNAFFVILFAALSTAGGHPETLFIGVVGIWIFLAWEAEKRKEFGLSAIIPSTVGALLGFLLLAVQIVPFLTILSNSYADELRPQMAHPFRIWGVASQLLPGVLGSPLRGELDLSAIPLAENFNLRAGGYIGAIVLIALILGWRQLPTTLKRGVVIGAVALILSWYPPGVWPLLRHLPVLRVLTLEYAASLFVLFGAMAAGPSLAIVTASRHRKIGAAIAIAGFLMLAAGSAPLLPSGRDALTGVARNGIEQLRARGHLRQAAEVYEQRLAGYLAAAGATTARRLALPGVCWLLAGIALATPLPRRGLLVSIAAAGELLLFGVGYNPAVALTTVPMPDSIRAVRALDPEGRSLIASHFEVFPANLGVLFEVRDVVSYDAMTTKARTAELLPGGYDPLLHTVNPILSPDQVQHLGSLGVRFVLSRVEVAGARHAGGPPPPAVGVYEIPNAATVDPPPNHRPVGLPAGGVITLLAIIGSAAWLRLYTLAPSGAIVPAR